MAIKNIASALGSAASMGIVFDAYLLLDFPALYAAVFGILLILYIAIFYVLAKKIGIPDQMSQTVALLHISAMAVIMALAFFNLVYLFILMVGVGAVLFYKKMFFIRDIAKILLIFIIVYISTTTIFQPSVAMALGQGTVLDDNWWNALNWIKNNTKECAVVATYWDPGHFITGIANRAVVFDGASQNDPWIATVDRGLTYDQMKEIAGTDKFTAKNATINGEEKTIIQTARIQDIATTLSTANETLALNILKKYKKPGCNEMYYLATADLIGKSYWWTYFSSWNPIDKGCATPMSQLGLKQVKPSSNGVVTYTFEGGIPSGCNQQVGGQVIITQQNNSLQAYLFDGSKLQQIEQFIYFTEQGGILRTSENAPVKGLVLLDPSMQAIIFIPPEIKDSMFTRMFFFNGQGSDGQPLGNFTFVNQWGGEVKLYKINFG